MDAILAALRAAAEPTRLRLLVLCAHGELTVSELTQILGQSQPRVSRHLKLLCEAGLLDRFREGTNAFFRLRQEGEVGRFAQMLIDTLPEADATLALDFERLEAIRRERAVTAAEYFRKNAVQWDKIRSLYVDEREVERALLDLLPQGGIQDLLDLGTGTGRILELVADRVERAVGIDLSREMLAIARANLERAPRRNLQVRQGDMYQLPWPAASFDVVTVHQVLHFADDPADALAEAARVLRPGGRLVIIDFAPHDIERLRLEHAHRWLGLEDAQIETWCRAAGLIPEPPVRLPGKPLTVCLWPATRTAAAALQPEAAALGRGNGEGRP
jgi:ubiquinone/menaquinone biosynthesis C-methylase UbiE